MSAGRNHFWGLALFPQNTCIVDKNSAQILGRLDAKSALNRRFNPLISLSKASCLFSNMISPDSVGNHFLGNDNFEGDVMIIGLSIGGFFAAALISGVIMADISARRYRKSLVKVRQREE